MTKIKKGFWKAKETHAHLMTDIKSENKMEKG